MNPERLPHADWTNWATLEEAIGLERLPEFHRAFLASRGVQTEGLMLRRVQQNVERELNRLLLEQQAERRAEQIWVKRSVLEALVFAGWPSQS